MEAKKKWIVALTSMCGVLFAAVIAMGIVWAATSQSITSVVKVTYTATEISGSISANVYFNGDTPVAMENASHETTVAFNGATSTTSGTLTPVSETVLQNVEGQRYVIYEYIITNASTTSTMSATLSYVDDSTSPNGTDTNVKVYGLNNGETRLTTPHTSVADIYGASEANLISTVGTLFNNTTIAAGATNYYYIAVAINDRASDAEFSGSFNWLLTKGS